MQISHRLRRLVAALPLIALCAGLQPVAAAERTQSANIVSVFDLGIDPALFADAPKSPRSDLVLATDGNIYFTGSAGGKGFGAVGRLAPDGTVSLLYAFANKEEGLLAFGGIMQGSDGNLYGTTYWGGANVTGTVYKLTLPDGGFTRLYEFGKNLNDPKFPYTGLVQAGDGNLYGTTRRGGDSNKGTVYRITTGGVLTVVHSFSGDDGLEPQGRLVVDSDGYLYGTTMQGGSNNRGVIYRVSTAGDFQRLYSFPRLGAFNNFGQATNSTGANPRSGLLRTAAGVFYGTAYVGGVNGSGTLYRAEVSGNSADVTVVHAFTGWAFGAGSSQAAPVLGPDGNLYGTSEHGGYDDDGAVWKVDPDDGTGTLLHSFSGTGALSTSGAQPIAGVLFANGGLYGATSSDGIKGAGYIYKLELDDGGTLPVDITVSAKQVLLDEPVVISWNAPGAVTCDKFGSWNEPTSEADPDHITPLTGTQTVTPFLENVFTYGLACEDAAHVVHYGFVAIDARTPALDSVDGGEIIGGGALSWLLLALFAALLFVKLIKETRSSCP